MNNGIKKDKGKDKAFPRDHQQQQQQQRPGMIRPPPPPPGEPQFRISVPSRGQVQGWLDLRRKYGIKAGSRHMWKVVPPEQVERILGVDVPEPDTVSRTDADDRPMIDAPPAGVVPQPKIENPHGTDDGGAISASMMRKCPKNSHVGAHVGGHVGKKSAISASMMRKCQRGARQENFSEKMVDDDGGAISASLMRKCPKNAHVGAHVGGHVGKKSAISASLMHKCPPTGDTAGVVPDPTCAMEVDSVPSADKGPMNHQSDDPDDHEGPTEILRPAVGYLRQFIFASHKMELAQLARGLIESGRIQELKGLEKDAMALVDRLATQLAALAVYHAKPQDLLEENSRLATDMGQHELFGTTPPVFTALAAADMEEKQFADQQQQQQHGQGAPGSSPDQTGTVAMETDKASDKQWLLRGRRERDAVELLRAQQRSSENDGTQDHMPIPFNNAALRDMVDVSKSASKQTVEKTRRSVISILANAMVGLDDSKAARGAANTSLRGGIKLGTVLMRRARAQASGDGVLLTLNPEYRPNVQDQTAAKKFIIVRSEEARQLLGIPSDREISPEQLQKDMHLAQTRQVLNAWIKQHGEHEDYDMGYVSARMPKNKTLADVFRSPPSGDKTLGFRFRNRSTFYNKRMLAGDTGFLPIRASIPLPKEIMLAFLIEHQAEMFAANLWQLFPDMVIPTCPAINLLSEGIQPYHMGAYAVLEEYTVLTRAAIDRFSTPAVRPPSDVNSQEKTQSGSNASTTTMMMGAVDLKQTVLNVSAIRQRIQMCSQAFQDDAAHAALRLPDWCGDWFVPQAFLPIPKTVQQRNAWYPPNDPALHPWLQTLFTKPNLVRSSSYQVIVDHFGEACAQADAALKMKNQSSSSKKEHESKGDSVEQRVRSYAERLNAPDCSREGRAETIMGLTVYWLQVSLLRIYIVYHHETIDRLRSQYGAGQDCGNGFTNVRPAAYYEDLFLACLKFMSQVLEAYELTLLVLSSRWINARLAKAHVIPSELRLDASCVENAHKDTVNITLERRKENLECRAKLDNRDQTMQRGFDRLPSPDGSCLLPKTATDWTRRRLQMPTQEKRPDLPSYHEMIVFDHLLEDVHETYQAAQQPQPQPEQPNDAAIDQLSQRLHAMKLQAAQVMQKHPSWGLKHHELPGNAARPVSSKRSNTDSPSPSSTKESGSLQAPPAPTRTTKRARRKAPSKPSGTGGVNHDDDTTMQED